VHSTHSASDKVYQLLAHGRWFFPGTPASSTTKTGRHDIAEILLKVALKHQKSKIIFVYSIPLFTVYGYKLDVYMNNLNTMRKNTSSVSSAYWLDVS
jgi:hypothetical protein